MLSKSGISWPVQERTSDPLAKFFGEGSKVGWHYNWNKNYRVVMPETSPGLELDAEFVPMLWKSDFVDNGVPLEEGCKYILGYNEPDHGDPTVASRASPAEAAESWLKVAKLREERGIKLVSPAVAHDQGWLHLTRQEFLSLIPAHAKPDYLAIHVYTTTFDSFKQIVEGYHAAFGLPIFVTEFAMQSFDPNVPPPCDMQQVHDFMGQTTKWLDETDWIVKYCWFGAVRDAAYLHGVHPFNRLMDEQGELTALIAQADMIKWISS